MSPSAAVTSTTDTYTSPGFITTIPLDMTGDSMCDLQALLNIWKMSDLSVSAESGMPNM